MMRGTIIRLLQAMWVLLSIACTGVGAFGFTARVASVLDGDTIEVYREGEQFKTPIELYGIDCPEKQQYFGYAAKEVRIPDENGQRSGGKTATHPMVKRPAF